MAIGGPAPCRAEIGNDANGWLQWVRCASRLRAFFNCTSSHFPAIWRGRSHAVIYSAAHHHKFPVPRCSLHLPLALPHATTPTANARNYYLYLHKPYAIFTANMPPRPAAPKLSSQIITNVDKQAVRDTNWPAEYSKKVDIRKVNMNVIETWIAGKLEQLGNDDDIVLSFIINLLKDKKNYNFVCYMYPTRPPEVEANTTTFQQPKIKEIQVSIRDFLGNDAPAFSKELWGLLLEAQEEENGVPPALVAAKKDELRKQKVSFHPW